MPAHRGDTLEQCFPTHRPQTTPSCQISGGIIMYIEIKCKINVTCLNPHETTPLPPVCLPQNRSLIAKSLGTTALAHSRCHTNSKAGRQPPAAVIPTARQADNSSRRCINIPTFTQPILLNPVSVIH